MPVGSVEPAPATAISRRLDALARAAVGAGVVPGLSIALADHTGPVWTSAYGVTDLSAPSPVGTDTVFEAASLTKPVVAYAVLLLVQEGRLDLDRPLDSYLPAPYLPDEPAAAGITARMVLGHTTGYPNWRPAGRPLTLTHSPGARFGYSGEGYVQVGRVVEHLTSRPLGTFLAERVLTPLGMTDSALTWSGNLGDGELRDGELGHRVALGHTAAREVLARQQPKEAVASSSLHTTATDLARFLACFLSPTTSPVTLTPDAVSPVAVAPTAPAGPLRPEGVESMLAPHVRLDPPLAWGLGWGLILEGGPTKERMFWQWGDNPGYKAFAAGSPAADVGVVVLTNGDQGLDVAAGLVREVLPSTAPAYVRVATDRLTPGRG
ncbi:CubicO group peptidase, beta-lactamase class C family [Actinopolymorpha cephalotaxi]|uniref:CubicO group peptidase (Beta-lactamase class C family) n=1 Tax=Actinopolymorpha cephalotaxi TaxID=504797 RepID=A0A1I2VA62_9ACTN|nr:serine hydrolase domain-containing protein [Actinopolymorpha cephalotaxi]NYH84808.1 CubicO group peptidase (beta-lactamase class C family) [Actinopolymorpha cephalotaxi]SFG86245.1 CubicO group peptidase, beta-lactamase class C family [Actinopolymorpha cephalotaxi]